MRLPLMSPAALSSEQRPLYDDMRKGIEANFKGFTAIDDAGQLIGPWNPWLHFPKFGGPVWELVKSLSSSPKLPRPVRESAILAREEAVAYDLASALVSGRVLQPLTYQQAFDLFGEEATAEFIYLVGLYCMVSVTLNGL